MRKSKTRSPFHYLTLIELMVVIILIGLISSVVAYNVQGSIQKGKIFKTEQAANQLKEIISLELATGKNFEKFEKNKKAFLKNSGLCKNPDEILKDGWGEEFQVSEEKGKIIVISSHLQKDGKARP